MPTTVNPGKAQQVAVSAEESFDEYNLRVHLRRFPLKFRDELDEEGSLVKEGERIFLDPHSEYSALFLKLKRKLTEQEFGVVFTAMMSTIKQFETDGLLPEDLVEDVSTPFDLNPPQIPQRFLEALEDGVSLDIAVAGEIGYELVKTSKTIIPPTFEHEFDPEPEE